MRVLSYSPSPNTIFETVYCYAFCLLWSPAIYETCLYPFTMCPSAQTSHTRSQNKHTLLPLFRSALVTLSSTVILYLAARPSHPMEVKDPPSSLAQVPGIQIWVSSPARPKNTPAIGRWLSYFQPWGPQESRDSFQGRKQMSKALSVDFR